MLFLIGLSMVTGINYLLILQVPDKVFIFKLLLPVFER